MSKILIPVLLLLTTLSALPAMAQYNQHKPLHAFYEQRVVGSERFWQRFSVGFGKHFVSGTMHFDYTGIDSSGATIDTEMDAPVRPKKNYAGFIGTFFPIALISDRSMLVFSTEIMASYMELGADSVEFGPGVVYKHRDAIVTVGVPLALEFKSGADIALSKEEKSMFSFGAGFNICSHNTETNESENPIRAIPFIKAEFGFVAGLAFKLRAMANFGTVNYIDNQKYGAVDGRPDLLKTKSDTGFGLDLMLVIMPISYGWTKD